jgi:hypothetical protein
LRRSLRWLPRAWQIVPRVRMAPRQPFRRRRAEITRLASRPESSDPVNPSPPTTSAVAASFGQQRLWFLDRFEPGGAVYHIPLAVRLRGVLDRTAASGALIGIVARHEVLRTTFAVEDDQVVQVIHSGLFPAWREEALADETELPGALAAEARRPFRPGGGSAPALRAVAARPGGPRTAVDAPPHRV